MSTIRYAKWSPHADRWVLWNVDHADASVDPKVVYMKPSTFAQKHGVNMVEEYRMRFGRVAGEGLTAQRAEWDKNVKTNPSLLYPGEVEDTANGRFYGRPLPEDVAAKPYVRPA